VEWIKTLNQYASLLSAAATFLSALVAALIALYLGYWREKSRRPKLILRFSESGGEPYFKHDLSFREKEVIFCEQQLKIHFPGFNASVQIYNAGKLTAKNVHARVDKVELYSTDRTRTIYYHPTRIKWSGEIDWNPVDIISKSHFFLDLFAVINSTSSELLDFNSKIYSMEIEKGDLEYIINDQKIQEDIYWYLWVKNPLVRGIPVKYYHEGDIIVYFTVAGENCEPLKFEAKIKWTPKKWKQPNIRIIKEGNFVNQP